jgi:flagellar biosynthesis GTPase FlhF
MSNFDFKASIREGLYNLNYSGDDKVRVVLNEGKTILVEREIHEGIMDFLRGYTKDQPGWEKELENQIGIWVDKSSSLNDKEKEALKKAYMNNLSDLPDSFYKDDQKVKKVKDSLEATAEGDIEQANKDLEDAIEDDEEKGDEEKPDIKLKAGDVVVYKNKKGQQSLIKVLKIDSTGGSEAGALAVSTDSDSGSSGGITADQMRSLSEAEQNNKMFFAGDQLNLKTGKLFRRTAKDNQQLPLSNVIRVASKEDIAKVKGEFPETEFFASIESEPGSDAKTLVDNNADVLVRFLKAADREASGKVKMIFKPFFEKAGIPWKSGDAVDDLLDLMRQVAINKKIRSKMASMANQQNESREFAKRIIKESLKAYARNEIKK